MDLLSVQHLLVVKPSSLGDVVHTLPAVHALRQAYPHLRISWLVNPEWAPLLEGNPDLWKVVLFPRGKFRGLGGLGPLVRWIGELEHPRPELALDFQGLTRSGLLCRLFRAGRVHCLSNAELPVRWLASRVVPVERHEHAVERYLRMIADLGVTISRPVTFPLPAGNAPAGFQDDGAPFVLLHPFSRGEGKSLTPAAVVRLCEALAPVRVAIVGRAEETLPALAHTQNLLNQTTLPELVWLSRRAAFVCSVDSGPMHIAAAVNERLLGIHTWTDPRKVGPYPGAAWVWKAGKIVRRADLAPELAVQETVFREEDVDAIASHIRAQLEVAAR